MYKILIADDEPYILSGLTMIINWEEYGIEIVASASNGIEAMDFIEKLDVDIIITDIKMPDMNGMQLIQNIKNKGLNIKIIILSGYDDFSFVKEATKLGVENYLLKPIEEDELSLTLQNIIERLDNERKADFIKRKDNNILKENVLFRWMTGNISDNELFNRAEFLDISLNQEFYLVCIVKILNRKAFDDNGGLDYLPFGVQNICAELLGDYCNNIVFNSILGDTIILFSGQNSCFNMQKTIDLLQTLINKINDFLNVNLIITIGSSESSYLSANNSYTNAFNLLDYHVVFSANTIISYDSIKKSREKTDYIIKIDYEILKNAVLSKDVDLAKQFIDGTYAKVNKSNGISPEFVKCLAFEILYNVYGTLNIHQITGNFENYYGNDFFEVQGIYTLPDIFDWLKEQVTTYIRQTQSAYDYLNPVVKSILKYIDCNYMQEISLKTLSETYHINAAYLGQLFKRATGELFSNYVNALRIEKAKKMLIDTYMKESDIANKVGYTNINYFSNLFKKVAGVYPSEYKKAWQNNK